MSKEVFITSGRYLCRYYEVWGRCRVKVRKWEKTHRPTVGTNVNHTYRVQIKKEHAYIVYKLLITAF